MPRVLIPSDQRSWTANFAHAYRQLGWEVITGTYNFELEAIPADVVHFNWPEELTEWKVPSERKLDETIARLDSWAAHSRVVVSVNNLWPHNQPGHPIWRRLYSAFYERADVIHHFSETSKQLVCAEYPTIANRNHVVRVGFNYDLLLPLRKASRAEARDAFGIGRDEIVYLVFGSLRSWNEVALVRDAFAKANVPRKRLLMSARYNEAGPLWRQRWRRWTWDLWQRRHNVIRTTAYVADEDVPKLLDAADCTIVIRQVGMSSGVPCLAMTFGRMVIAPDSGSMPEYVGGAGNLLYDGSSSESLATAMERAAGMDRESVGARNREIAADRTWERIITTCVDALPGALPGPYETCASSPVLRSNSRCD